MDIVEMKMNQVEIRSFPKYILGHDGVMCYGILALRIEPERPGADRHEPGIRYRIAAGEQRHIMAQTHQFLRKPGHDTLGASIQNGWNTFEKRCYLRDSHRFMVTHLVHDPCSRMKRALLNNRVECRFGL